MKSDNEMQQAMYTIEHYKSQVENLTRQRQMVMMSMEEHMRARVTITDYSKQKDGHEILVPAGANTFIFAKSMRPEKVLIGIGGDVVIEDSADGAVAKLDEVITLLEDADKRIIQRITDIESQMNELSCEVEKEMGQDHSRHRH